MPNTEMHLLKNKRIIAMIACACRCAEANVVVFFLCACFFAPQQVLASDLRQNKHKKTSAQK
ncbi:unnamed protein product [Amoebophrya sp. A25]|nr:unnamed protein product [Amoebophrya sp. A25]|eukprot:GSA25T00013749001.1